MGNARQIQTIFIFSGCDHGLTQRTRYRGFLSALREPDHKPREEYDELGRN